MADPYRSNGSAAYDVRRRNTAQPLERPERLPDAPARHKPARHVRARLGISPLTALGAAAAVLMLALADAFQVNIHGMHNFCQIPRQEQIRHIFPNRHNDRRNYD